MKANKSMKQNDEAVSPVIGVILMVAITVILAAVIGAFVFGMGPPEAAPQASLRASTFTGTSFIIEHQGGDEISRAYANTHLLIRGTEEANGTSFYDVSDKFTVGEQVSISTSVTMVSGDKITLVDVISQKPIATFTVRL